MAFSDGDPFVSGSLYSFQQGNRMMQNYRGATVPSNLQDGALWSDSDDDRLWHQGASLDEVFTGKTTLTWENLLANSGFGVWSQSDASKGLATITYDQGAKGAGAAPSVGDAVVGGTSGATAKVISYTTATGAWATNDATGVVTVGAVSSDFAFVDNETITFGGVETAVINMADTAVQVGLVANGGFATDTDPPEGWQAGTGATLTTEGAGQVGNCLMVLCDGTGGRLGYQNCVTVVGKIYKWTAYFKKGTGASGQIQVGTGPTDGTYFASGSITDAAWTKYSGTFEATTTQSSFTLRSDEAAATAYFDEVTLYEATPCCTAADALALDGWIKDTTVDIYRQHNDGGTYTKDGSFYAMKVASGAANDWIMAFGTTLGSKTEFIQALAGREITIGIWGKTSTASHLRLRIFDDVTGSTYSSYHTGGGAWEWLEVTATISATATAVYPFAVYFDVADTVAYISQSMKVLGMNIGEGNYQPKQQEVILSELYFTSNKLNAYTARSTEGPLPINVEADTDARFPKGCKVVYVFSKCRDSGSAGADCYLYLRADASQLYQYFNNFRGLVNDSFNRFSGEQKCDVNGDYEYQIDATGAGTFDLGTFIYTGVQVN